MIVARELSVSIGHRRIVDRASFTASAGELTAIVGPNGSGKTTLLRALSGDASYSGHVSMNGTELSALKPWRLAGLRAVLPQSTSLSFPFTVSEIVGIGLTGGRSGTKSPGLVEEALARVDLPGFGGRFYQELSGGEQQRVQLARVLCQVWVPVLDGERRWLFLDEPVSSLDLRHQLIIMRIARDFAAAGGGVLCVLHDLNLTAMFAHNVLVMKQGRLASSGEPQSVLKDELLGDVFGCSIRVGVTPPGGGPFVLPQSAVD